MDSMLTLTDAFADLESTIERLLTLVYGLESRLAVLESGHMPIPVAIVASAQTASWPSMGGHAIPLGSATQSAPPGQPKPKSSIKSLTMPTSHILQCVAHPTSNALLAIPLAQDLPPTDGHTPCIECVLELPNSLVVHVVGHQGQGLKQALDISGTCLVAFTVSLAGGDHQFVSIWGSDQQIGEALVVIGKWIAKK
ncbi:hypothetical protein J132_04293 [Termitomyces sp. J132]|nr:hypothetical protein J132_04293 [Termitomyces sp. J132]